jgi:hypothetical protein
MGKPNDVSSEFLKPSLFEALKQELIQLEATEPGSKVVREAIKELMPLVRGCRDRGHAWNQITLSFQKYVPELTVGTLRKHAFEFDPSLKGSSKVTKESIKDEALIPDLDNEPIETEAEELIEVEEIEPEQDEEPEDEDWPPAALSQKSRAKSTVTD